MESQRRYSAGPLTVRTALPTAFVLGMATLLIASCAGDEEQATPQVTPPTGDIAPAHPRIDVVPTFPNLAFESAVALVSPEDGSNRFFVSEQDGRILVFANDPDTTRADLFLDIREKVTTGFEEGLIGIAFHPDYSTNGYFYVHYTAVAPRRSVFSRFTVSPDEANRADPDSEEVILEVDQPSGSHNGGQIGFGPDGYLYLALGMGGGNGDPEGNAQNLSTLLGSILRIDVNGAEGGRPYRVPVDNPFVGNPDARDEIWAYGFRNPHRFAFDEQTEQMWAGDVGQGEAGIGQPGFEEVDLVEPGKNYGWVVMEGFHCYPPPDTQCDDAQFEPPVVEYQLYQRGDCAVIGGQVYRGEEFPEMQGVYFYGDFCSGNIRGLWYDDGALVDYGLLMDTELPITAFGHDATGTIYVLPREGQIHKLVSK